MSRLKGHIKLHRKIVKWRWFKEPNTVVVWLAILAHVEWRKTAELKPGQWFTTVKELCEITGLKPQQVRTALNHLTNGSTNEITIKSTNKFSIVSIVNWEKYQGCDDEVTNKVTRNLTNDQQTTNKQLTTEEEYKNIRTKEIKNISYEEIVDLYHENCPSLPKVTKITDARKKLINARLKDYPIEELEIAFNEAEKSDFLTGRNGSWKASFDWIMNTNNIVKILEGNYENKEGRTDKQIDSQAKGYQNGSNADFLKMLEDESRR